MICSVSQQCGGCPQIEISRGQQREAKLAMVRALLERGLANVDFDVRFNQSKNSGTSYRNRIRLRVDDHGEILFFNPEKDPSCVVLLPELLQALRVVRERLEPSRNTLAKYSHIEIRTPDLDGYAGVDFVRPVADQTARRELERAQGELTKCLGGIAAVSFGRLAPGRGVRREDRASFPFQTQRFSITPDVFQRVPLGGFMQVNFEMNRAMVERVVEHATDRRVRRALDLYCGSGNFLLPLLRAGIEGVGVEIVSDSIRAARMAAKEQGWDVCFAADDVATYLSMHDPSERFDLAVVDPPRGGLKEALGTVVALSPPFVALCSCNPKTMVLDLEGLVKEGYRVNSVELFDMFPGTDHVETLCFLSRSRANASI